MNVAIPTVNGRKLRLLVAIASYGARNIEFLKKIIRTYQNMSMDVDVVVVSEAPKDLGPGVEVVVGLPTRNPWSLPFAHKRIFAGRLDSYDLFAYSEDDMEVTEENIQAFLRVSPALAPDEIAGFLRYEVDASGNWTLPEVHGSSHWRAESVRRRGSCVIAEFSNEHSGFYLLTQNQLRRAIASGGFLREPCEGRYDMLCTAATDPYTNCGFHKVVCVSELPAFLIHHAPDHYAGKLGVALGAFGVQIEAIRKISEGTHPVSVLCRLSDENAAAEWTKHYYEKANAELVSMIPKGAITMLSVGCGWGATEAALMEQGIAVTALPLDSVIGAAAAQRGIEVIYASLEDGLRQLEGRKFGAVVITDLLQLLEHPAQTLSRCARLLDPGGVLVMAGPNLDCLPVLARRLLGAGEYRKPLSVRQLSRWLQEAGLECDLLTWQYPQDNGALSGSVSKPGSLNRLLNWSWQSVRRAGLRLDEKLWRGSWRKPAGSFGMRTGPGTLLAPRWVARAFRQN